jgi:flagellar basal-body rod protein FlgG
MFGTIRSGMATSMFEISVVSNNIANAGTTAFRKSGASFSDLYSGASVEAVSRLYKGGGSIVAGTKQSTEQGGLLTREGVLNLALIGKGMFVSSATDPALGPTGRTYTRDGAFLLDKNGVLRTSTNDFVLGYTATGDKTLRKLEVPVLSPTESGAQLTALEIDAQGQLLGTYGTEGTILLGQIAIGAFPNETALRQMGMNRFQETGESGTVALGIGGQDGFAMIRAGVLETSNVNLTSELTNMIRAQQQFSGSSRILQTYSDMIEKLTR